MLAQKCDGASECAAPRPYRTPARHECHSGGVRSGGYQPRLQRLCVALRAGELHRHCFGKSSAVLEKVQEQGGIWYTFPMNDMSQKVAVLQQKLLELQDYL